MNTPKASIPEPRAATQANMVCLALCKEIENASCWDAVLHAWGAILTVRRMEKHLTAEERHLMGGQTLVQSMPEEKPARDT